MLWVFNMDIKEKYLKRLVRRAFLDQGPPKDKTLVSWCFSHAMAAVARWAKYDLPSLDNHEMKKGPRAVFKRFLLQVKALLTKVDHFKLVVAWTKVTSSRKFVLIEHFWRSLARKHWQNKRKKKNLG